MRADGLGDEVEVRLHVSDEPALVEHVVVHPGEASPHIVRSVADVVREDLHGSQSVARDGKDVTQTFVQLDVDVQVGVDTHETAGLVPGLHVLVVSCPRLEAHQTAPLRIRLRLAEQRGPDAPTLVIRMHRDVPDHPAESGPVGADGSRLPLALDVDEPDDRAGSLRHELDGRCS